MTEHPTSHETRQSAPTAASSALPAAGTAGTAPLGGVPDPRSALQQPVGTGHDPAPGTGFAVRGGDDNGLGGATGRSAATASAGPPAGQGDAEPAADHGPAGDGARAYGAARAPRDSSYGGYTGSYGGSYDPYGEVAMPAEGRPDSESGAERAAVRAGRPVAQGAVDRAGPPDPGEEPGHAQPRPDGAGVGRPREGDGAACAHGGEPGAGGLPPGPPGARGGGRSGPADAELPPPAGPPHPPVVPPARSAHPGESSEVTAARQASGDRLRFIGAATRRIARGIDLDEIVLGLCRATVPTFADAILVYLRDPLPVGDERPTGPVVLRLRRTDRIPEEPDTNGLRLPVLPAQPDLGPAMGGSAAELAEVRPGGPLAEVLRGVRPLFGEAQAARTALPELLGPDTRLPGGHRVILAPLRGRRRVIGAAVFLRRPDRPAFEPDDLLVAAQLATHTALGVDKAVLYGREAYIADALQRTMLPDSLPQPTGVRLASRYLPAAETARVGGDWYDAIPLPGSRVALVVGDVMGHSMTSAAIMGQLRTTAQTLAGLDLPPQEVLHHLDEQAQRLGSDRMATCLYAVYDPVAHRIIVANAGHPPPVMLHRGGRAEVLRVPPGAPIGVGGVDFEAVELDAPAGATLVLYTDGLVESRIRDVWTGIEQLRERLAETARLTGPNPPPLEPLCDEVLDMLGPGDRDDDIALLAARFDGIAPSDVAYWYLDPKAQTAGQARRLARRALARWGLDELSDQLELLVSEVVTNAVRYAERPVTLRLLRTDVLRCEVGDDVPQLPRLRQARPSDEGGRGLYLVNRMARRWGATRLSMGKVVWFELSMPPGTRR
ncbi:MULTISPECIES: SpoIIE family protein phosphatase [Streptomyces]|uniref:SpoIIE family protein phosphatase n=1 Tax=Streptomyces TaxID=1883 RepID=UPI00196530AA|nr:MULTISPECIES: SpoIIE family protein phosphatase [Streptomyces]QRX94066.1 SpoIIE family protein phosphatase [Streptomyces noursei]UJB43784.1 SpoIIE family protein phosphatase [Streptomyces sp. A1-5]